MTALLLRPLEVLVRSAYIIAGAASPASLRGAPASAVVLGLAWVLTSAWSDALARIPGTIPGLGPVFELLAWTCLLRYLVRRHGDPRRLWQAWLAVAGVSTLVWALAILLKLAGAPPVLVAVAVFALAVRGLGRVLQDTFDDIFQQPYFVAGAWCLIIGVLSLGASRILLEVAL